MGSTVGGWSLDVITRRGRRLQSRCERWRAAKLAVGRPDSVVPWSSSASRETSLCLGTQLRYPRPTRSQRRRRSNSGDRSRVPPPESLSLGGARRSGERAGRSPLRLDVVSPADRGARCGERSRGAWAVGDGGCGGDRGACPEGAAPSGRAHARGQGRAGGAVGAAAPAGALAAVGALAAAADALAVSGSGRGCRGAGASAVSSHSRPRRGGSPLGPGGGPAGARPGRSDAPGLLRRQRRALGTRGIPPAKRSAARSGRRATPRRPRHGAIIKTWPSLVNADAGAAGGPAVAPWPSRSCSRSQWPWP